MIKDEILNLCEGRFESLSKNLNNGLDNTLSKKYGLGWNGGDPIYNTKKNNATLVSFGLNRGGKFYDLVDEYISFPKGKEAFLEYNLRTKKFRVSFLDYRHKEGETFPKFSSRELPKEFNNEPLVKEAIPLIVEFKTKLRTWGSQLINNKDIEAASKYAETHNLTNKSYFNY